MSHWDKLSNDLMYDILERKSKLQYDEVVKELNLSLVDKIQNYLKRRQDRYMNISEKVSHLNKDEFKFAFKRYKYFYNFTRDCIIFLSDLTKKMQSKFSYKIKC